MATQKQKDIFARNIKYYLNERDMTQTQLAKILDYPEMTVSNWVNAKYYPRIDKIQEMADFLSINKSDLIEDKPKKEEIDITKIPGIIPIKKIKRIPILGVIHCGEPIWAEENFEGYFSTDPELFIADFSLYATGDSMIDANIYEGDLVFFRKTPSPDTGTIVAVLIDDEAALKKYTKTDTALIFSPCNDKYNPIVITETTDKSVMILGEMVAVLSKRNK